MVSFLVMLDTAEGLGQVRTIKNLIGIRLQKRCRVRPLSGAADLDRWRACVSRRGLTWCFLEADAEPLQQADGEGSRVPAYM